MDQSRCERCGIWWDGGGVCPACVFKRDQMLARGLKLTAAVVVASAVAWWWFTPAAPLVPGDRMLKLVGRYGVTECTVLDLDQSGQWVKVRERIEVQGETIEREPQWVPRSDLQHLR